MITVLNICMFVKLRKIWKQRRELKKAMQSDAIPVIATPSMNHRIVITKDQNVTTTYDDDDVYESSSGNDKSLRHSARLRVTTYIIIIIYN